MESVEVTSISSRGQVVIPQRFREQLSIREGEKFLVMEKSGMLIFKRLVPPTMDEFERMMKRAHDHAIRHHLTPKDAEEALKRVRSR